MLLRKYVRIWENILLKFDQEENMNDENIYSIEKHRRQKEKKNTNIHTQTKNNNHRCRIGCNIG